MNKVITNTKINTKVSKARRAALILTFLNSLAATLGSLAIVAAFTMIAVGLSWWKVLLFVGISLIPTALLFAFKAVR